MVYIENKSSNRKMEEIERRNILTAPSFSFKSFLGKCLL